MTDEAKALVDEVNSMRLPYLGEAYKHDLPQALCRATIYHGTPLTPRAALVSVCTGRAMCVSFYRPDDVEVVEAISPAIMFRQRRVLILEGRNASWSGMGRNAPRLVTLFPVAGAAPVSSWPVGCDPRHSWRAIAAKRCAAKRMAVWAKGRTALAYGRADRTAAAPLRQVRPGLPWLDRRGQGAGQSRISRTDGGSGAGLGQPLARPSHDARDTGGV